MAKAPSLDELRKVCFDEHVRGGTWVSAWFWRPLSPWLTWCALSLGIPSAAIAFFNLVLFLGVIGLLFFNGPAALLCGGTLLQLVALLDHVDGDTARFEMKGWGSKNSRLGHYFDLLGHRFTIGLFFALGWSVTQQTGNQWFLLLGFGCGFLLSGAPSETAMAVLISALAKNPSRENTQHLLALRELTGPSGGLRKDRFLKFLKWMKEGIMFPGFFIQITAVCFLDAFLEPLPVGGSALPWRGLLLIVLFPFFTFNFFLGVFSFAKRLSEIQH